MYTNSLAIAERQLSSSPIDPQWLPQWLLIQGYSENQLKRYDAAIASLDKVLAIQKDDADALFQRASAYMSIGNLDAARTDYRALQKTNPDSFEIADKLGNIAWQQRDTNEAVRNFQIYAAYAPTNTAEYPAANERLNELEHPAGGK